MEEREDRRYGSSTGCEDHVADEIAKADNAAALINEKAAQYNEMQASALAAAKRGYVDDIIELPRQDSV